MIAFRSKAYATHAYGLLALAGVTGGGPTPGPGLGNRSWQMPFAFNHFYAFQPVALAGIRVPLAQSLVVERAEAGSSIDTTSHFAYGAANGRLFIVPASRLLALLTRPYLT